MPTVICKETVVYLNREITTCLDVKWLNFLINFPSGKKSVRIYKTYNTIKELR